MSLFESINKVLKKERLELQEKKIEKKFQTPPDPWGEDDGKNNSNVLTDTENDVNKERKKKFPDGDDGKVKINKNKPKNTNTKYQRLRDQRTKYNVLKNKQGVYKPSIAAAKAKMGERLTNITKPPDPKAVQKNALNASPARMKKLNKAIKRAARFEPGAGVKEPGGKDYRTRILDRITKNQEGKIDTSKKGRIARMKAGISAKSPTIPSKTGKGRIPMPGAPNEVDFATGGKGVNQKGIRTDQAVRNRLAGSRDSDLGKVSKNELNRARREQEAYDKQVRKNQAQLKKKGGAKYYTGKDTPLNKPVLGRSDFNLQKVYDDLSTETGGKDFRKRGKNQPTYAQVKAELDKKYPVKQGKTGLIPDKSTGAYGSANELKRKRKKIIKKIKNNVKDQPSTSGIFDFSGELKRRQAQQKIKFDKFMTKIKGFKTPKVKPIKTKPTKIGAISKILSKSKNPYVQALAGATAVAGSAIALNQITKRLNKSKTPKAILPPPTPKKRDFIPVRAKLYLGSGNKGGLYKNQSNVKLDIPANKTT